MLCIDMWETFRVVAKNKRPNCKVVVDKFHILQEINRRVKRVRITIMNQTRHLKITDQLRFDAKQNDMKL